MQSEELVSKAKEQRQRQKRRNESARATYYRHREQYLNCRRKRYHENPQVRAHKLKYQRQYRQKNIKKY